MPREMWAQTLVAPRRFVAGQVPAPKDSDLEFGEVLVNVVAGGICGSDLPVFRGRLASLGTDGVTTQATGGPGLPIHEVVGVVVGSRHPAHEVGSTVVGWATRWNGIAEYVVTDGEGLAGFDARLVPTAAVMLQPLACVMYAVSRLPKVEGASVAVIGLGPIGLLFSHLLKSGGARRVIGIDRIDRSDLASQFGLDETVHASSDRWARNLAEVDRPELVIEAVGHQGSTLNDAIEAVAPNGLIYNFGIPDDPAYAIDMGRFLRKNLTMVAGVARERRRMLVAANNYVASYPHLVDVYVTHTLEGDQIQDAFELADRPAPGQVKVTFGLS